MEMLKMMPSSLRESNLPQFLSLLRQRVATLFVDNPMIQPIEFEASTISDQGINFDVKLLKLLAKKPTATKDTFSKKDGGEKKVFDPFMPPYEEGQYIDELSATHALIFNKYSVVKHHCIVITKDFKS